MPSIAQWISGLFGSVDLAPSDITAALVLAAAAQRRRRKNRIKRALNPIIKAASNAATSQTSDQLSETTGSVDERKSACWKCLLVAKMHCLFVQHCHSHSQQLLHDSMMLVVASQIVEINGHAYAKA